MRGLESKPVPVAVIEPKTKNMSSHPFLSSSVNGSGETDTRLGLYKGSSDEIPVHTHHQVYESVQAQQMGAQCKGRSEKPAGDVQVTSDVGPGGNEGGGGQWPKASSSQRGRQPRGDTDSNKHVRERERHAFTMRSVQRHHKLKQRIHEQTKKRAPTPRRRHMFRPSLRQMRVADKREQHFTFLCEKNGNAHWKGKGVICAQHCECLLRAETDKEKTGKAQKRTV